MEDHEGEWLLSTQLTGLGELQLQPHMVYGLLLTQYLMRMQMWSSVRVVVQIITGPATVNGAEFATGFSTFTQLRGVVGHSSSGGLAAALKCQVPGFDSHRK
jgi:hypothetical protein